MKIILQRVKYFDFNLIKQTGFKIFEDLVLKLKITNLIFLHSISSDHNMNHKKTDMARDFKVNL